MHDQVVTGVAALMDDALPAEVCEALSLVVGKYGGVVMIPCVLPRLPGERSMVVEDIQRKFPECEVSIRVLPPHEFLRFDCKAGPTH